MIREKVNQDINQALRSGDKSQLSVLRILKNSLDTAAKSGDGLDEEAEVRILQKEAKQRQESIKGFESGGREDLAEKERRELEVIERYLPEQLDDAALSALVEEAIASTGADSQADIGKVMGVLADKAGANADKARMAEMVRSKLS